MTGRVNSFKKMTRRQYEIIKELSLLGAAIMMEVPNGLAEEQQEALENLISMCGGAELNEDGDCIFEYSFNERNIELYNEMIFWRELAEKLASRDTLRDMGETITEYNIDRYEKIRKEYLDRYLDEFKQSKYSTKLLPY